MKVSNQKRAILSPCYNTRCDDAFDPVATLKKVVAEPLFVPQVAGSPVVMTAGGTNIDEDYVTDMVLKCFGDHIDPMAEASVKELMGKCLLHYDQKTNLLVKDLFAVQSGTAAGLAEPDANTLYTPSTDVIPTSRDFLAGYADYDKYFATMAYYTRSDTFGVYCANEVVFDNFKDFVAQEVGVLGSALPGDTCQLAANFQTLSLKGLTESIVLRKNDSDNCDPKSFARLIVMLIQNYVQQISPAEFGLLPFSVPELICPKTIVFVNVERHSRATSREVADEWKLINNSLSMKPNMVSNNKLTKLTAAARNLQKIAAAAASAQNMNMIARSANIKFSKTAPTMMDMTRIVKKILDKMAYVNKSMNIYKTVRTSFAKPNRRDPDDFNKQGKIVSTQYKPDIHLYIDTSGSISEYNYEEMVKACIQMAKKLNINLYFNSFSSVLSQCTKLNTKDKSLAAIYREFQKVPKVSGGTDYEQIWHYINRSKKRRREISLIITDFEWYPPNRFVQHPKNLYYVPCGHSDWKSITYWAEQFCKGMGHIDPQIRKHVLF